MTEKMKITAYEDISFSTECGSFTVQVNPDSFTRTLGVTWNQEQTRNSKNGTGKAAKFSPEKYSFTLYFDGTGILPPAGGDTDVLSSVRNFLRVVYQRAVDGEKKKVSESKDNATYVYCKLSYCGEEYQCVADNITVNYTLFDHTGRPLRAKVTCSFSSVSKPAEAKKTDTAPKKKAPSKEVSQPEYGECCECCSPNPVQMVVDAISKGFSTLLPTPINH